MRLQVEHVTEYHYDPPVRGVVQSHRLRPACCDSQQVLDWQVSVSGGQKGGSFRDGAGDLVEGWSIAGPVSCVIVSVRGEVETRDTAGVLRGLRESVPPVAYLRATPATRADAALIALAQRADAEDGALALAHGLAQAVSGAIRFRPGCTGPRTTAAEALAQGAGVCQDHAQALIACARSRGLPARYVAGYLQADAVGASGEAAHAWAEIWIEGLGWIGFDPTNRCCPDARYIRLGSGLDAAGAAPIRGVARGNGQETMAVRVAVADGAPSQAQQ